MKRALTPDSPYWRLFIDFHSGRIPEESRERAKSHLFHIHYGSWDTTRAMDEVARQKVENDTQSVR